MAWHSGRMKAPSTGIQSLDGLIDGLRYGDNVVWEIEGPDETPFMAAFLRASRGTPLVYVSLHVSPQAILDRFTAEWDRKNFLLIDCFTDGLARGDPAVSAFYRGTAARRAKVERVEALSSPGALHDLLGDLELRLGHGARYVFDSLTGMQELWGQNEALMLFLRSCPRLYELRTAAYWLIDRPGHDAPFLSRMRHITQVVLQLTEEEDTTSVRVAKAQGRGSQVAGRRARVSFDRGRIRLLPQPAPTQPPLGEALKAHRIARGLSQAELARKVGISPSALSQAERGHSGLSPTTLDGLREALGLSTTSRPPGAAPPYRVSRRGARDPRRFAAGMVAEELAHTSGHRILLVRVAPEATGRTVPFVTKRDEAVVVLGGVIEVRVGEAQEVLHAGDAILLSEEPIASWRNPGPQEAELLWTVLVGA